MHLKHAYRSLTAVVGLLVFSGCYAPYGAYPPGAYQQQGGAPMQYQGVPQSSYVMPGDGMGSPSSGVASPQSTFAPSGNLQAPNPTARGAAGSSPSPVPLPRDPDPSAERPTPAGEQTSQLGTASGPPQATLGEPARLDFQSPIVLTGADDRSAGGATAASGQSTSGGSGGYDPNYNWFQGRLEYVESDQAWHLTYDDAPVATDQLGGDITLSSDVKLEPQHNGRLVRVSGKFDDTKLDRLQKPVFRVSQIDPL
jgi:hypothetical protein